MSSVPNVVEEQYSRWIYPIPVEDMRDAIATGRYLEYGDPHTSWPAYWPRRRALPEKMDILVAGCGTNQGAYYACRFPESRVTAVDLSESSLAHEEKLKKLHGLDNLTLKKMDLLTIGELGQDYDYIVSSGVLHHLPEPARGFETLKTVLRPEGVMHVMVYGTSLRLGVYLMQNLFRTCGLKQTPEDLQLVKETLALLPADHAARRYMKNAHDLKYEAGMVDTFLHRQDRSFYVPEIFEVFRGAGLEFLGWLDNLDYSLEAALPARHPLWRKLNKLDAMHRAHACDLLTQTKGTHRFVLAHPDYVKQCRIPFDSDEFLDCSCLFKAGVELVEPANTSARTPAKCRRRHSEFQMDYRLALLLERMANGTQTLRQAIESFGLGDSGRKVLLPLARRGFKSLWNMGHIFVLLPERRGAEGFGDSWGADKAGDGSAAVDAAE